jgi:MFS family permease
MMGYYDSFKGFWKRQAKNFKVLLTRDIINSLFGQLTGPYTSIFMNKLGAGAVEIGFLTSINSFVTMSLSIHSGLLVDRVKRLKRLFLAGRLMELPISLVYAAARSWYVFIVTNVWGGILGRVETPAMTIIQIESLKNEDRVTGMAISRTITSAVGILSPMLAAFAITYFGGLDNVDSFRPLYIISFFVGVATFILLAMKLEEPNFKRTMTESGIKSTFNIFKKVPGLKMIIFINILNGLFVGMRMPLLSLYSYQVKGANAYIIGLQATITTAVTLIFSMPMGNVADRVGRRRLAYVAQIVYAACVLAAVLAPTPEYLLLYTFLSALGGTMQIGWDAFLQEYIPLDMRGRWFGVSSLIGAIVNVPAPILGGLIWDINPDYLWWISLVYYAFLAIPLMMRVPELGKEKN